MTQKYYMEAIPLTKKTIRYCNLSILDIINNINGKKIC